MALASTSAQAHGQGETIWIPMRDTAQPQAPEIRLEATLYRPDGDGPFPLVVFNHGSTGPGVVPASMTEDPQGFGHYLVARGVALLIPMRRGRGRSEGRYREPYECSLDRSRQGIDYASTSLDAVYAFLRAQAWADPGRIVLSGTSRGGMLSVVYAAERPGSAIGVVNFVGGWMGDGCNAQAGLDINAALFAQAGASARVPHLFLYGSGDPYYCATPLQRYADAFGQAGGAVDFRLYELGPGVNGHGLFRQHWRSWRADFEDFLAALGMWPPRAAPVEPKGSGDPAARH